jgi:O-antigen ligase
MTAAALPLQQPPLRGLAGALVIASLLLAGGAWAADAPRLAITAVAGAALVVGLLAPEVALALFVAAGALKAAPWVEPVPFDLTAAAALAVGAAMVAAGIRRGLADLPLEPVAVLAVSLCALVVLSSLWTPAPAAGLDKAFRFQAFSLLAVIAPPVLIRRRVELVRVLAALVGFALVLALTARPTEVTTQPLATLGGNEIQLGVYSGFALLAILGYLRFVGPPHLRPLWFVPAGMLGYALAAAGSRGALISSIVALVFLMGRQLLFERSRSLTLVAIVFVALIAAFGGASVAGPGAAVKYQESLFSSDTARIVGSRDYLVESGVQLGLAHPLGLGVGGFDAVTQGLQYPHNLLLELADEQGLVGVVLFLALLVCAWRARYRGSLGRSAHELGLTGALIVFALTESMVSFDLNGNRLLWFAFGLAAALPRFSPER